MKGKKMSKENPTDLQRAKALLRGSCVQNAQIQIGKKTYVKENGQPVKEQK